MKRSRHRREHSTSKNSEVLEELENSIQNSKEFNLGNWTNFVICVLFWTSSSTIYCTLIKYSEYFNLSLSIKYIFQYQLCDLFPFTSCHQNNQSLNYAPTAEDFQINENSISNELPTPLHKFLLSRNFYFSIFFIYNFLQLCCTIGCYLGHKETAKIHENLLKLQEQRESGPDGIAIVNLFNQEKQIQSASLKISKISVIIECCKDLNISAAIILFLQFFHVGLVWLMVIPFIMTSINIYREFVWKIKYKVKKKVSEIGHQVSSSIKNLSNGSPVNREKLS